VWRGVERERVCGNVEQCMYMSRVGWGEYTEQGIVKKCYPVELSFIYKAITTISVLVYLYYIYNY
jgi:hypothetical protein